MRVILESYVNDHRGLAPFDKLTMLRKANLSDLVVKLAVNLSRGADI